MAPSKEKKYVSNIPQLLAEWDWEKNSHLSPHTVSYGSAKRAWWICSICGHQWESPIYSRGANGCGCPECAKVNRGLSKKKTAAKRNGFVQQFPQIAREWHPIKNIDINIEDVSAFSNIRAWWKCEKCGYEWETTVNHRTKEGNKCPVCSRKHGSEQKSLTHAERNNFAQQKPDIAKEWHPRKNGQLKATDVSVKSNKKVWWLCGFCGYEWEATVNHRSAGRGCPNCSMAQTSFAEQAVYYYVAQAFPDAINRYKREYELDIFIPSRNIAIEYDGYLYHQADQKLKQDNQKDVYCQKKGIKLIRFREPRLPDTTDAHRITYEEHHLDDGIRKLFEMLPCSIEVDINVARDSAKIRERFRNTEKEQSLAIQKPHLITEWHPEKNGSLTPYMVYPYSNMRAWWKCEKCNYEWQATANHRASRNSNCPLCAGRIVVEGKNDLATIRPDLIDEWNFEKNAPLLPAQVAQRSNRIVWWKCKAYGHEWQARVSDRTRDGHTTNCPYCGNKKVLAGFNDLATVRPDLLQEWHYERNDIKPTEITDGSKKKVWWLCKRCGWEWQAAIYSRKHCGCPRCTGRKEHKKAEG